MKKGFIKPKRYSVAFTLAEVLITLGVIGVVAAMTMPVLITKYQKSVTVTKLKRFASVLRQADMMRKKDLITGENSLQLPSINEIEPMNGNDAAKIFKAFFEPYIKIVDIKIMDKGVFGFLSDDSVMYYQKVANCDSSDITACSYIVFCTEYKYCSDIDEKNYYYDGLDQKHNFLFWSRGETPKGYHSLLRNDLLLGCRSNAQCCSALIEMDGWEIKDDYPW